MSGNNYINTGGGNYNHSIQGDYNQGNYIQGDYVRGNQVGNSFTNINQEPSEILIQIQQRLLQLQTEGKLNSVEAKAITAKELATQVKAQPTLKQKLITLAKDFQDAATDGLIGEAAVEVVKLALKLLFLT